MNQKIILLKDYRGFFYGSTANRFWSFDIPMVRESLERQGFAVDVRRFGDIDFREEDYRGVFVLYQSSEDQGGLYKNYIEDILLGFEMAGAVLIPRFHCFRAHHNKVFMELLRDLTPLPAIHTLCARSFGTLEEACAEIDLLPLPAVIKPASGACGAGIELVRDRSALFAALRRVSRSAARWRVLRRRAATAVRSAFRVDAAPRTSLHENQFIVQTYLPGLDHDHKVLVYGSKYYVVRRENRANDFRASGSGRVSWPAEPPEGLLDFARTVYEAFDVPFISLDIAGTGGTWHLLEMQFVLFGNLTLEGSSRYFVRAGSAWSPVDSRSVVEQEFARSVVEYIGKKRKTP